MTNVSEVVAWNPHRPPRLLRRAPGQLRVLLARPENNLGDLLGPMVVAGMLGSAGIDRATPPSRRLLAVGSILHMGQPGDVIWGAGRNGRVADHDHRTDGLDVRAVRGPLTREWLRDRGVECPAVFGDPALLMPLIRPDLVAMAARPRHRVTFVRHIDDRPSSAWFRLCTVSARADLERVLRRIVQSRLVVSTSLHAVIVAEAFGIPARSIRNRTEPEFKFADYYLATGRPDYRRASSISEALALGGEPPVVFDSAPLLGAFPYELFPSTVAAA